MPQYVPVLGHEVRGEEGADTGEKRDGNRDRQRHAGVRERARCKQRWGKEQERKMEGER